MRFDSSPSWRVGEDMAWPLAVALYIRDVLRLPVTVPFFVPPLSPAVPEQFPVTSPDLDDALADEWELWFADLLANHLDMPRGGSIQYFSLWDRAPGLRDAVEKHFESAAAAAGLAFDGYFHTVVVDKTLGMSMTRLVAAIERELGHRAAPFHLDVRVLPVEGEWIYRSGLNQVLVSETTRKDPAALRRLLGPIIAELA